MSKTSFLSAEDGSTWIRSVGSGASAETEILLGVIVDGQSTLALGTLGDGGLEGVLDVEIVALGVSRTHAQLDLQGINIINGVPTGGAATLTMGGIDYAIASDVLHRPDFSSYLAAP